MNAGIWRLALLPGKKWMAVIPHDLEYFNSHFVGQPLPPEWRAPPYTLTGTSKKVPDFMSWMSGTPLVRERVAASIAAMSGGVVQFPFFDTIRGEKIFALNVLGVVEGALDTKKSDLVHGDPDGRLIQVRKAVFATDAVSRVPAIFKIAEAPHGDIYVTREFCDLVVRERFTGVGFADPEVDALFLAVKGLDPNVYPGVIG